MKAVSTVRFSLLSILVGVVAGLGAVFFRGLIALFHNLLFQGKLSLSYNTNVHTPPSPLGPFIIFIPVLGALLVAYLVKTYAPEAKGHGVPEVMDAIYYRAGRMRPIVAVIKSLASSLSIGSGGSVGREGPIVQIGSSFGATIGDVLHVPAWQRITLIAAGAGGGIAATFNTPVGGVLFALELMLHEVSARTLVPVTISTVTATYIGQMVFGLHPAFVILGSESPYFHLESPLELLAYAGLGVVTGLASALFISTLYVFESIFETRVAGSYYRQHALGMLLVGLMMYSLQIGFGHYYIEGVGYATIQDMLSGARLGFYLLLLLFSLKLLATCLTLGSGASGGVFSPALFMGATVGAAYGMMMNYLVPALNISPTAFAVVGMSGVVAGSTAAAVTSIVMIFEMTLDLRVIVPMTLTVAISYGVRRAVVRESIYTRKLALRGHSVPEALQTNMHFARPAKDVMDTRIEIVPASTTVEHLQSSAANRSVAWLLVMEENKVIGVLAKHLVPEGEATFGTKIGHLARRDVCTVSEETQLGHVSTTMLRTNAAFALVTSNPSGRVMGVISKDRITDAIAETIWALEEE